MKHCQYWWSITRALLKTPYWLYTRSTYYFTFRVPAIFLNCVKWLSFSSHFLGAHWWIGGQQRSQVWYWTGVQTGRIPAYGTDQSHWYYDPKYYRSDCMYMWTDGDDDISDDGLFNILGSCSSGLAQLHMWKETLNFIVKISSDNNDPVVWIYMQANWRMRRSLFLICSLNSLDDYNTRIWEIRPDQVI